MNEQFYNARLQGPPPKDHSKNMTFFTTYYDNVYDENVVKKSI